jgi:hypothetical protein
MRKPKAEAPDPRDHGKVHEDHPGSPEAESRGAHGRYGMEEEPVVSAVDVTPPVATDPGEIARDAARDAEVRNTGEDLSLGRTGQKGQTGQKGRPVGKKDGPEAKGKKGGR